MVWKVGVYIGTGWGSISASTSQRVVEAHGKGIFGVPHGAGGPIQYWFHSH